MSTEKIFFDVLGLHVLALWFLAEEIQPDNPQSLATKMLQKARTQYDRMSGEELGAIAEKLLPKHWPPDESL